MGYTFTIYIELKNGDYLLSRKKNVQMLYEKLKLELTSVDENSACFSWSPSKFDGSFLNAVRQYQVQLTPYDISGSSDENEGGTLYSTYENNICIENLNTSKVYAAKFRAVYSDDIFMTSQWVPLRIKVPSYNLTDNEEGSIELEWKFQDLPDNATFFVKEDSSDEIAHLKEPMYTLRNFKNETNIMLDVGVIQNNIAYEPVSMTISTDLAVNNKQTETKNKSECSCYQMKQTQNELMQRVLEQSQTIIKLTKELEQYRKMTELQDTNL